ncbi:hypothetical protein AB0N17_10040 [Streptomyces sp. NPDC051133]|uniref:hypothetical protein n=1 Tax=Streptomyces sp. NPDC051133 TaxID=3155521 RepID=UPI003432BBFA
MPSAARVLSRCRRLLPVAVPAMLCLTVPVGVAPRAAAAAGGWSVAPSGGDRPSLYAEGPPGAVLRDTVSVTNSGRKPVAVRLSGTGVRVAFAGQGVRVPARTRADVPFTVTVPAGAGPGDRAGTIVVRAADGRTVTVPLRLRVRGPALAALTVEHLSVHPGRLTYELVNRGTTVLVPRLAVRADGVLGRVLDRPARVLPVHLRPGARLRLSEPWPDQPALDSVDVRLTVTAPGGARDTATASARFVPWGPAAGVAGGALVLGAVIVVRRRGSRTTDSGGATTDAPGADGGPAPDRGPAPHRPTAAETPTRSTQLTGGVPK